MSGNRMHSWGSILTGVPYFDSKTRPDLGPTHQMLPRISRGEGLDGEHDQPPSFSPILLWLYRPLLGLGRLFNFLIHTVGRNPWMEDQPVTRPLSIYTQNNTNRINAHRHSCLEWDSSPVFERAKTVHALDRAATVIGTFI
jgi:hypothetical protein